jgi:dihydropyrimidinase
VLTGRMSIERFVALTATNHAQTYGLYPRKGTIALGCDADIAIWDPKQKRTIRAADLHDRTGYTPYEGMNITGWPTTVISRGEVIIDQGTFSASLGRGQFLSCGTPQPVLRQRLTGNTNSLVKRYFT